MQCLLRRSGSKSLIAGMSKVGFSELRRTVATTCRAVLLTGYGGPEMLELRDGVSIPELKPTEVLVRTRAVAIDEVDQRMRQGYGRAFTEPHLPLILGRDISGVVAAVGHSVSSLEVGQNVFGALHSTEFRGTYTEYAILDEKNLVQKPDSISHAEASVLAYSSLTSFVALTLARMKRGQRLFVVGEGAVALATIQLAVTAGCDVTVMCNDPTSVALVLDAGAQKALLFTMEYDPPKFDAVVDTVSGVETERLSIRVLKRGGNYIALKVIGTDSSVKYGRIIGPLMIIIFLLRRYLRFRLLNNIGYWPVDMICIPQNLQHIARLAGTGELRIPVAKIYPIEEVREAHKAFDTHFIVGKIVLEFK